MLSIFKHIRYVAEKPSEETRLEEKEDKDKRTLCPLCQVNWSSQSCPREEPTKATLNQDEAILIV